ncbi:MAG TPA: glycerate kinase [Bryobacteraceae bacterium]|nr:glycerate kinase [Bryobacteraceae bacterium]
MNLRKDAIAICKAALRAADPYEAMLRHVRCEDGVLHAGGARYRLDRIGNIYVVGAGKACAPMAKAVEKLLGKRITASCVIVKDAHTLPLRRVQLREAAHPVPDQRGVDGALEIAALAERAKAGDLMICLISGGASALMPAPADGFTLEEKQGLTRQMLAAGANIHEMNAVRKHLSRLKGGQLARLAAPAHLLTLILSDVIGDDLSTIGSGPTAPDPTTWETVDEILARFALSLPHPVPRVETPKPGDPLFQRVKNVIIGSNALSVDAASAKARELGYRPLVLSTTIEGETRDVARMHVQIAKEARRARRPVAPPACILSGGETTVTLRGSGMGGRNQEFALMAGMELIDTPGIVALSAGTDGTDGPTEAAGGIADAGTVARAAKKGRSARADLDNNDSYRFLEAAGDLLVTGPTRTNVMDIRILLVGRPGSAP